MDTIMIRNTVLVTGASGFIGASLIRRLHGLSEETHILTRKNSNKWRIKDILPKLIDHEVNFEDEKYIKKLIEEIKPQVIYHMASFGGYPFQKDLKEMVKANIIETVNLLEATKAIDYNIFVNIGSSSEYGYKTTPMNEKDALRPASFYAATKASSTYISQVFSQIYNKPIVTIRPFSVYGPYEEPTRFISSAIANCLKGTDLKLTEGSQMRDYIYIEDFITGLLKIASSPSKVKGEIINLGCGKQYSVKEVASIIMRLTNSSSKMLFGAYKKREWDSNFWVSDNSLLYELTGWKPSISIEEGLKKTVDWFRNNLNLYGKNN